MISAPQASDAVTGAAPHRPRGCDDAAEQGWGVTTEGRAEGMLGEGIGAMVMITHQRLVRQAVARVASVAQPAHAPERGPRGSRGDLSAVARAR